MTASNSSSGPEKNFNAKEERKLRKPLIEKRRRERINSSLEQLKGIMVDAYNLDVCKICLPFLYFLNKQSKLEKADVLEITVQHMEGLQRGHGPVGNQGPSVAFESRQRYSSGYIQCMHEHKTKQYSLIRSDAEQKKKMEEMCFKELHPCILQEKRETGTSY
ncbi:hypothetical protein NFI96_005435 [Prochilodus magdalenae]|nr:hypothetical protein NFI96_005435 [Prochilodus magdalenae]